MHKWQRLVRALGVFAFFCGFAGQSVRADGSVSSTNMGYGASNLTEFRHFQSVIGQYNASGERFRIDSHCQSACTMFLSIRNVWSSQARSCCFTLAATGERVLSALPSRKKCSALITLPCAGTSLPTISWTRWSFIRYPAAKSSAASATGHAAKA